MRISGRPRRLVRGFGVVTLFMVLALGLSTGVTAGTFVDVSDSHPYALAIDDLASRHIINGFPGGLFKPDDPVKRQQFAKMIVLALGLTVPTNAACPFADVDTTPNPTDPLYPAKYVAVCAARGITTGKNATTFDPAGSITREQLVTMIARAAGLADPPAGYTAPFSSGQFSVENHYLNARKAAKAGLLAGLQGVGPGYDFTRPSDRGECAQLLHNLLESGSSVLPGYADLQPTGPIGYSFQIHTEPFDGYELGGGGQIWIKHVTARTIEGHLTIEMVTILGNEITWRFVIDALELPPEMANGQDDADALLPIALRLTIDEDGGISEVYLGAAGEPEEEMPADIVDALSPVLAPVAKAMLSPYAGQMSEPGDSVHIQESPVVDNLTLMNVDALMELKSVVAGIAKFEWGLDITDIDIPLNADAKPMMPLFGYSTNFGADEWIIRMNLGSEISAEGTYDLDLATGMPNAMTLESVMTLDARDIQVPPEFALLEPDSDFFTGQADWAYIHDLNVTFTIARD